MTNVEDPLWRNEMLNAEDAEAQRNAECFLAQWIASAFNAEPQGLQSSFGLRRVGFFV